MSCTMSKESWQILMAADREWLMRQPKSIERDHIETLLKQAPALLYERELDEEYYKEIAFQLLRRTLHVGDMYEGMRVEFNRTWEEMKTQIKREGFHD